MSMIDHSLDMVRRAAALIGKKPLAARAEVSDALLRDVGEPDFSPNARTLRKLEAAARAVLLEKGERVDDYDGTQGQLHLGEPFQPALVRSRSVEIAVSPGWVILAVSDKDAMLAKRMTPDEAQALACELGAASLDARKLKHAGNGGNGGTWGASKSVRAER